MTVYEGIKGQKVLTELRINSLAKRWAKTFDPTAGIINFVPRTLYTYPAKIDFEIFPQEFEASYLGKFRMKGQKMDIPFEGYIMEKLMLQLAAELNNACINGVAAGVPAGTDLLAALFNGITKIAKLARTGGHTAIPVAGGAYTTANIIGEFNEMRDSLGGTKEQDKVVAYCSVANGRLYLDAYRAKHQGNDPMLQRDANGLITAIMMEDGDGWIYPLHGWGTSNFVLMTFEGNFAYAVDDVADYNAFRFKDQIRSIQFAMDFKVGVEFAFLSTDYVAMNDLN